MKATKKKFIFTAKWDSAQSYLKFGEGTYAQLYLAHQPATCVVGAALRKWLGDKPRKKVTITVSK